MIEKFKTPSVEVRDIHDTLHHVAAGDMFGKINELVDAVNELQKQVTEHDQEIDDCATDSKMEKVETSADVQDHKIRSTNERLRKALNTATKCINWIIDAYKTGQDQEADILGICELTAERINEITKGNK